MQIVARTNTDENGPALLPHQAAIREIRSIHIGAAAENSAGKIFAVAPTAAAGAEGVPASGQVPPQPPGMPPAGAQPMSQGAGAMMPAEGMQGVTPAGPDPIAGRYVDNKSYLPLSAEEVRSAATSGTPEKAYLAVAKRMPVRMQVRMDQRKLNKFLIECGNADLMLEVKQVRINPDAPDIFGMAGSAGRGAGGGNFGSGVLGGGRRGGFAGNAAQMGNDSKYPWDVDVEVYGIVYIFNPPSLKRLEDKLDAEAVAKFEVEINQAPPASAVAEPADQPAAAVDEAKPATDAGDAPAAKVPPADTEEPTAPPPADAAKAEAAPAPAG
jgi:hypothetical protein